MKSEKAPPQRSDLSPAERAAHIAERKRIYKQKHGPAKAIGAAASNQAQGKGDANENFSLASSFTKNTGPHAALGADGCQARGGARRRHALTLRPGTPYFRGYPKATDRLGMSTVVPGSVEAAAISG